MEIRPILLLDLSEGFSDPFLNGDAGGHLFADDPVDRGSRGMVRAGDLAEALPTPPISEDGSAVESKRRAADVLASEAGAPHAGADPLDNKVAFELRDRSDDDHDGAAQRAAGVDVLSERGVLDVEPALLTRFRRMTGRWDPTQFSAFHMYLAGSRPGLETSRRQSRHNLNLDPGAFAVTDRACASYIGAGNVPRRLCSHWRPPKR